jgi:hypothetical protein
MAAVITCHIVLIARVWHNLNRTRAGYLKSAAILIYKDVEGIRIKVGNKWVILSESYYDSFRAMK